MAAISMQHIVKRYGDGFPAVNDVSLEVADGEFMILVGPSGCGKSTLLNMIAGFLPASAGSITVGGQTVKTGQVPKGLGYIFQKDTVLPWLTVADNIGLGLRYRGVKRATIDGKAVRGISPRLSVCRREAGRWLVSAHANFAALS